MNTAHKKIILIGGAPGVGKTYLAKKLGKEFKLPWISTDTIREQMRKNITRPEDFPHLFRFQMENPVDYLTHHAPEEIVDHINLENGHVWKGVSEFIEEGSFGDSYIIEGIAIQPEQIYKLMKYNNQLKPIFLLDYDVARLRDVIYTRGLWDAAFKYPDNVKEKELAWVVAFNDLIANECAKYRLPTVEMSADSDKYIAEVKELIYA